MVEAMSDLLDHNDPKRIKTACNPSLQGNGQYGFFRDGVAWIWDPVAQEMLLVMESSRAAQYVAMQRRALEALEAQLAKRRAKTKS
jgi:hypothetical protein